MTRPANGAATPNAQRALRDAGWQPNHARAHFGFGSLRHTSGAVVARSGVLWTAVRATGERLGGIVSRATAIAWATGSDVSPWTPPERAVKAPPAPETPDGWVHVGRGMQRHANGTVDVGCAPAVATLRNGERRSFREKRDAILWVEGNGVFKPGHVPAERRGA